MNTMTYAERLVKLQEGTDLFFVLWPTVKPTLQSMKVKDLKEFASHAGVSRKTYSDAPTKTNIIGAIEARLMRMCHLYAGYPEYIW